MVCEIGSHIPSLHVDRLVGRCLVWLRCIVRLVNNAKIPVLLKNLISNRWLFCVIDARDELRMVLPRVRSWGKFFFHCLSVTRTDDFSVNVEEVVEGGFPLFTKVCRCDDENAFRPISSKKFAGHWSLVRPHTSVVWW